MAHRRPVGRHLVLDNQAASALLRGPEAERRQVIEALAAADGGSVVPSAVRVEAGWDPLRPVQLRPPTGSFPTTPPWTGTAPTEPPSSAPW